MRTYAWALLVLLAGACGPGPANDSDAGSSELDAGGGGGGGGAESDAGAADGGASDAGQLDGGQGDAGAADAGADSGTGDATPPAFVSAAPGDGGLIDWRAPIALTFDEELSPTATDHAVSGTLTQGSPFTASVSGTTLTLTPNPTWAFDSDRELSVVVKDKSGNASATTSLRYDVLDGALYVRKDGADSNRGTRSAPKLTIAAALTAADAFYATGAVRVAAGVYNETLTVPSGIELLGGYSATNWAAVPSRTQHETRIEDLRTGAGTFYAVTLQPNTRLERFKVLTATAVSGTCAAVSLSQNLTGTIRVVDNELEARTCSTNNAVRATSDMSALELSRNVVRGTGTTGSNLAIDLVLNGGAAPNILIDGNDIRASATSFQQSHGISLRPNTSNTPAGTVTIRDNFIWGGGATYATSGNSSGITAMLANISYVIERNRVHGGTGAVETYGVRVAVGSATTTLSRNAIFGGEPQLDGADSVGVYLLGQAKVWNNLVSGGGRVHATVTNGDSTGLMLFTSSAQVANNTIHLGFLSRGASVHLNSAGSALRNNVLFAAGQLSGGAVYAVREVGATSDPVDLRNNRVDGFGSGTAYVYQDYVTSGGTCPGLSTFSCYSTEASLNDEAITTGGAAGTADSNSLGAAGFQDVDGADNSLQTLIDANGAVENDWRLGNASAIKTSGLDGVAGAFGFTDDFSGTARTGNGATGWSIGAYENDN